MVEKRKRHKLPKPLPAPPRGQVPFRGQWALRRGCKVCPSYWLSSGPDHPLHVQGLHQTQQQLRLEQVQGPSRQQDSLEEEQEM